MTEADGDNSQPISHGETGRRLKAAREAAGLELQVLADQLHLRPVIVRAIEEGDYGSVPSELFLKGYVRSYARHIGVSDDAMIATLSRELAQDHGADEETEQGGLPDGQAKLPLEDSRRRRRMMSLVGIALVVLVLLLLPFIWPGSGDQDESVDDPATEQPEADQSSATGVPSQGASARDLEPALEEVEILGSRRLEPSADVTPSVDADSSADLASSTADAEPSSSTDAITAVPPQPPEALPASEQQLQLSFTDDCWVEVVNGEGNRVVARLATEGDRINYSGPGPFDILLGAVSAVDQVEFMGQSVDVSDYPSRAGRVRFQLAASDFSNQ